MKTRSISKSLSLLSGKLDMLIVCLFKVYRHQVRFKMGNGPNAIWKDLNRHSLKFEVRILLARHISFFEPLR